MKDGTLFCAPSNIATATSGFVDGLVPPTVGWAWQPAQLFRLNRGPRPVPLIVPAGASLIVPDTEATSLNWASAAVNKLSSAGPRPGSAPPAPAGPPRTPGSCGPFGGGPLLPE